MSIKYKTPRILLKQYHTYCGSEIFDPQNKPWSHDKDPIMEKTLQSLSNKTIRLPPNKVNLKSNLGPKHWKRVI